MRSVDVFQRKMVDLAQAWRDMQVALGNAEPSTETTDSNRYLEDKPAIRKWMEHCELKFDLSFSPHSRIPLMEARIADWVTAYRQAFKQARDTAKILDQALSEAWDRWVEIDHRTY